jgi:hypothetical protein
VVPASEGSKNLRGGVERWMSIVLLAATAPGFITTRTAEMKTNKSEKPMCDRPTDRPWGHRPTWELKNIVRALSLFPWLNTEEDLDRLAVVKRELALWSRRKGNWEE